MPAAAPANAGGQQLSPELAQRVETLRGRAHAYAEERGLPFVTLSYAQSLDGSIAAVRGQPLALSGALSLTLTHALRAAHDAIVVGIGTVLADDPRLTVRLVAGPDPQPVVVDSSLRLPHSAKLLQHPRGVWLATTDAERPGALPPLPPNVRVLEMGAGEDGRVDLPALLAELGRRGIRSVMVEGGSQLLTSFLQGQLAQAAVITIAPSLVGGLGAICAPLATDGPAPSVTPRLASVSYTPAGDDLVVWGDLAWPQVATVGHSSQKRSR
jgi:riboflavin-specific deaminase-like protein